MDNLVERLRTEEGRRTVKLGNSLTARYVHREDVRALLREAADALEAAWKDAERLDWLSQFDVGICLLDYGDYQWYSYANPKPEHGMLGLRAVIDAARGSSNG